MREFFVNISSLLFVSRP